MPSASADRSTCSGRPSLTWRTIEMSARRSVVSTCHGEAPVTTRGRSTKNGPRSPEFLGGSASSTHARVLDRPKSRLRPDHGLANPVLMPVCERPLLAYKVALPDRVGEDVAPSWPPDHPCPTLPRPARRDRPTRRGTAAREGQAVADECRCPAEPPGKSVPAPTPPRPPRRTSPTRRRAADGSPNN